MKSTISLLMRGGTAVCFYLLTASLATAANPWTGAWALTLPDGRAGWLGVEEQNGQLRAHVLWGGGSVLPAEAASIENGQLKVTRLHTVERKDAAGKTVKIQLKETITATAQGEALELTTVKQRPQGGEEVATFTGRRQPPLPPAPDLRQVKFGAPITLFNGKDLTGWRLTDPQADNGWHARDGLLVNDTRQEEGKPRKRYGNLRTDAEFEDFNLRLEVRVPPNGNSGIYLRGIYEVQVSDSYGKPVDAHHLGAIYSRITPRVAAEKPAGEWQTLAITLVDRHVTVVLNGVNIIDNQPLAGCTGGALWSDVIRPGPIYLQGDHTNMEYRHLVLRPRLR